MPEDLTPKAVEVLRLMQEKHPRPLVRERVAGRPVPYQGWQFADEPKPELRSGEGTVVWGRTLNILVELGLVVIFNRRRATLTDAGVAWQEGSDG